MDEQQHTEIIRRLADIEWKIEKNSKKIDVIDEAIRGNGQPGIKPRLRIVETGAAALAFLNISTLVGLLVVILYVMSR